MIPQVSSNNVKTNAESNFNFTIKTSAHAFKILSDSLYSNKVLAVVREYLTNALDAHRDNNKLGTAIETNISLDNEWTVRDYGKGLSQEDIQNLFCTYFSSSKTDTNEQTGMLGLGCKSGFAYSDQFTVTSWFNGKETIYHLYIEDQVPKVSIINCKDSSEPTGLQISIPIKGSDVDEFLLYEKDIFKFFPEGVIPEKYLEYVNTYHEELLELPSSFVTKNSKSYVLMGSIIYPLDIELLNSSSKGNILYNKTAYRIFKVPTGAVNILPSREGLSYDKKTKDYLLKLINKSLYEVTEYIISIRKEQKPKKYNKFGKGIVGFHFIKELIQPIYNKEARFSYKYKYFNFNVKFEKHNTYEYETNTRNYIEKTQFRYKPLSDIFILETKQRSPKENKLIDNWLKQEGNKHITIYVYKTKHKKMHKPLRKYLKTVIGNKIFNSYAEFFKYAYGEENPKLNKPKQTKKVSTGTKPKAKLYTLNHLNTDSMVDYTLKEIKDLAKDSNNYFVINMYGLVDAFTKLQPKQNVYLVEPCVSSLLLRHNAINYNNQLEALFKQQILQNYKKDLIIFNLIRMMSHYTFWEFLSIKKSTKSESLYSYTYINIERNDCLKRAISKEYEYIKFLITRISPDEFKNVFELNIPTKNILKRIHSLTLNWLKKHFGDSVVFHWFSKQRMFPRCDFADMVLNHDLQDSLYELLKDIANDLINFNQYYSK